MRISQGKQPAWDGRTDYNAFSAMADEIDKVLSANNIGQMAKVIQIRKAMMTYWGTVDDVKYGANLDGNMNSLSTEITRASTTYNPIALATPAMGRWLPKGTEYGSQLPSIKKGRKFGKRYQKLDPLSDYGKIYSKWGNDSRYITIPEAPFDQLNAGYPI